MIGRARLSYGVDLSLRHGAIVEATTFFGEGQPSIRSAHVKYVWDKKSHEALTEKSTPDQIFGLVQHLFTSVAWTPGIVMGIDYDDRAAYWTRRPGQVAKQNFLLAYFARAAHEKALPTVMISPRNVRSLLGLEEATEKNAAWNKFREVVDLGVGVGADVILNEDARDALMLAYLIAAAQEKTHDLQHTVADPIPSGRVPTARPIQEAIEAASSGGTSRRSRQKRSTGNRVPTGDQ